MNIWFGQNAPIMHTPSALTIGNFDGVHIGHRHILQRLRHESHIRKLNAIAIIFEPQPTEFFARKQHREPPPRLSPLRDKIRLLAQTQCLDGVWVQRFNADFAAMRARDFIENTLIKRLNTQYLLIGDDFQFGQNREGNFATLQQYGAFITENTPSVLVSGSRASSTAVRQALITGDLARTTHILGQPYSLSGRVKHGAKLGRTLGFPTANVHLPAHHYAPSGVFIVNVFGRFGRKYAIASFGKNPTVSPHQNTKLEVYLFDFSGDIYGEHIEVHFLHKLRDEHKYPDLAQLKAAIHHDIQRAHHWLNHEYSVLQAA